MSALPIPHALNYREAVHEAERLNAEAREHGIHLDFTVAVEDGGLLATLALWMTDDDKPVVRFRTGELTGYALSLMADCYLRGERDGKRRGRFSLQHELRELLDVPMCEVKA